MRSKANARYEYVFKQRLYTDMYKLFLIIFLNKQTQSYKATIFSLNDKKSTKEGMNRL